jgi:hypothetical protein
MKKVLLFLLTACALFGASQEGYEVYKAKCSMCHIENISKVEVKRIFKSMKAPPMVEVANRLKSNIIIGDEDEDVHRKVVTLFIKNYIDNPQVEYTMCEPMAVERFGVMPSQKGKLTEEQKEAVAEWIYDRFEGEEFK